MRAKIAALLTVVLLTGCPEGDPADTVGTATDSASTSGGTTEVAPGTSSTTGEPEPEPETAGSACGDPLDGEWGDCINFSAQACGNEDASCLTNSTSNPAWGTCIRPCEDRCDCWAPPEGGSAEAACAPVLPGGVNACVLDCSDGQMCPGEMICVALTGVQSLCVFENASFDPTGPEPTGSTGDGSTGTTGDGSTGTTGTGTGTGTE